MTDLFKLFGFGVFLGVVLAGAAAYLLPVTDLQREASIVSVQPNGGNSESWRIHVPDDRVFAGSGDSAGLTPPEVEWPTYLSAAAVEGEVFKVRDANDVVIGLASRIATANGAVEWLLHFPARGSLYFPMSAGTGSDGTRQGALRAGTREFENRSGRLRERYLPGGDDGGTIELQSILVAVVSEESS